MFNRRVPKHHPRIEACGSVDELNAALGLARALAGPGETDEILLLVQRDLVAVMGELATAKEDAARYAAGGYQRLTPEMTSRLELQIRKTESESQAPRGWATPGGSAMDVARTAARRAERRVCALQEAGELGNPEIILYLNRLSDLLWLTARAFENPS
jgi:cob(I)alamin adenosyltransferase